MINYINTSKENFFKDLPETKKTFLTQYVNFLDNFKTESELINGFANVIQFINLYPTEFHQEIIDEIGLLTLSRMNYSSKKEIVLNLFYTNFIKFLENEDIKPFISNLKNNTTLEVSNTMIYHFLNHDNTFLAEKFSNIFQSVENKNMYFFNEVYLERLLEKNKNAAIHFLLNNFTGWDSYQTLKVFFKNPILDNSTLEKILSHTGKFTEKNFDILINILKYDISPSRKVELIETFTDVIEYYKPIHNLYSKSIKQRLLSEKSINFFNNSLNNEKYLINIIKNDIDDFFEICNMPTFKDILPDEKIFSILANYINTQSIEDNFLSSFFKFAKLKNINLAEKQWHGTIVAFLERFSLNQSYPIFQEYITQINYTDDNPITLFKNKKTYKNLHEYLIENGYIMYGLYLFKQAKTDDEKENIFQQIINSFTLSYKDFYIQHTLLEQCIGFNEFFDYLKEKMTDKEILTFFIDKVTSKKEALNLTFLIINKLQNNSTYMVFDLKKENPLSIILEKTDVVSLLEKDDFFFSDYRYLFAQINEFFNYKFMFTNVEGKKTPLEITEKQVGFSQNVKTTNKNQIKTNKFLQIFSKQKIPLQLIYQNKAISIIEDPDKLVELETINKSIKNKEVIINELNSVEQLLEQTRNEAKSIYIILEKFDKNDLNIEFKIRVDNLLLENINFLEKIKSSSEALDFSDMLFLKHNFCKYLTQCIEVYGKAVLKYETLIDPKNKKIFNLNSIEDIDKYKDKIDNEALRQLTLLEKALKQAQEHIVNQFSQDILRDMRVGTRILEEKVNLKLPVEEKAINVVKIQHRP